MSVEQIVSFLIATLLISITPGPTVILVTHYAMIYGKWSGRYTVSAVFFGLIIAATASFVAIFTLVDLNPQIFDYIRKFGGLYLFHVGTNIIYSNKDILQEEVHKPRARKLFTHVAIVTILNPKIPIFLMVFFPPSTDFDAISYLQIFSIISYFVMIATIITLIYDFIAGKFYHLVSSSRKIQKYIHWISGVVLAMLGASAIIFE